MNTRPPWLRPVRKKTPNTSRGSSSDAGSHRSSPDAVSLSEYFVEPPVGLASPQPAVQAFSPTYGSASQYLNANRRASLGLPPYLDTSIEMDPGAYMASPADVMSMFGDSSMDVSSMFAPDFAMGHHSSDSSDSLYGHLSGASLVASP